MIAWEVLPSTKNKTFAQYLLLQWLFALYSGTFEAFFFNRVAPMWFVLALALGGLRCTRLFAVKQ